MDRVAIFADVQNIYYTVRQGHGCHFDYRKFLSRASSGREVVKAIAYAIDRGDEQQRKFQKTLERIGFEIKLKPFIQRSDGSAKGDWDVGIALDVIEYAALVDVIVLASGDGDFDLLVDKAINNYDVQVEVYGVPELTAQSLIDAASRFIPVEGDLLLAK